VGGFTSVIMVLSSRTGRNVVCSECPLPTLVLCRYLEVVLGHSGRNCGRDEVQHVLLSMTRTAGCTTEILIPHMLPGFCILVTIPSGLLRLLQCCVLYMTVNVLSLPCHRSETSGRGA